MLHLSIFSVVFLASLAAIQTPSVHSFTVQTLALNKPKSAFHAFDTLSSISTPITRDGKSSLWAQGDNEGNTAVLSLSESDQVALGGVGTTMSLVMLCSEYVLKTTGCGLPAGPFGVIGAVEGISYLGVTALTAFSVFTKVKTGSGLPAGPKGILGLAEGLSFLAIVVGIAVLLFQVVDYGYIPNAVPVEGGICK